VLNVKIRALYMPCSNTRYSMKKINWCVKKKFEAAGVDTATFAPQASGG
jgi:hypothetical protein